MRTIIKNISCWLKTDDIKAKVANETYQILDDILSKVKSDIWEDFGVLKDCENNVVNDFAACKKFQKVLALHSYTIHSCHYGNPVENSSQRQRSDCVCELNQVQVRSRGLYSADLT